MGLKCKISYDNKGVAIVTDDSGNPSELYNELRPLAENQKQALNMWATAYTDALGNRGEAVTVDELLRHFDSNAASESRLSTSEEFEVKQFMRRNGVSSLTELHKRLTDIFKANGTFYLDKLKAVESGFYTKDAIDQIDEEQLAETLQKIEGTLSIKEISVVPEGNITEYINSEFKTILGSYEVVSQEEVDKDIIESVSDFSSYESFLDGIKNLNFPELIDRINNQEGFGRRMFDNLKGLRKLQRLSFVSGEIVDGNNKVYTTVKNTILSNTNSLTLQEDIDYLNSIEQDLWDENQEVIKELLKEVEARLIDLNLDVIGMSGQSHNREGVMSLLESAEILLENPTDSKIAVFSEFKENLVPTKGEVITELIDERYDGYNIVSVHSDMSEVELFDNYGLIKIGDNIYHNVDQEGSVDMVKDLIYNQLIAGEIEIPSEFLLTKDLKDKTKVLENISTYLMSREVDSRMQKRELYSAYQVAFNHSVVEKPIDHTDGLTTIKTDTEYLKSTFISDFYNYILKEKMANSEIYRTKLIHFEINDRDLSLIGNLDSIEGIKYQQELSDYIKLKKDSNMKHLVSLDSISTEDLVALNFPETVPLFQDSYLREKDYVVTGINNKQYINVEGEIFRKGVVEGSSSLYLKVLAQEDTIYYDNNLNFDFNEKEAREFLKANRINLFDTISVVDYKKVLAKAGANGIKNLDLKGLSTLKDQSYIFIEDRDSILAYKDGQQVGRLTYKDEGGELFEPNSLVDPGHRGNGVGTEMYLRLFDKARSEGKTYRPSENPTKQEENILARVNSIGGLSDRGSIDMSEVQAYRASIYDEVYESTSSTRELVEVLDRRTDAHFGVNFLAPNGEKSNLTRDQYYTVRTKEFKDWFGDWQNDPNNASKVLDENGEPLVVYHGSPVTDIEVFDRSQSQRIPSAIREYGTFFTTNPELSKLYKNAKVTEEFSQEVQSKILKLKSKRDESRSNREYDAIEKEISKLENGGEVYPVFLNIRRLNTFDAKGESNTGAWDNLIVDVGYDTKTGRSAMEALSGKNTMVKDKLKVDGVKAENIVDMNTGTKDKASDAYKKAKAKYLSTVYLLFDGQPNNIKSATDNVGTFDKTSPNIKFQQAVVEPITIPKVMFNSVVQLLENNGLAKGKVVTDAVEFKKVLKRVRLEEKLNPSIYSLMKSVNGFKREGVVYVNPNNLNMNTPMHEFGHLWYAWAESNSPTLSKKGRELIKGTEYYNEVKALAADENSVYYKYSENDILEEALVRAIGDKGEAIVNEKKQSNFKNWWTEFVARIRESLGLSQMSDEQFSNLTLEEFTEAVNIDLIKGEKAFDGTNSFNAWRGNNRVVSKSEIQEVKTGEPIVAEVYHGTTHNFYEFDSTVKGTVEGHFGRLNYFTSDKGDASKNYMTEEGPDLQSRIERLSGDIESQLSDRFSIDNIEYEEIASEYNLEVEDIKGKDFVDIALIYAKKELTGGSDNVLDLYVKLNNPLVIGEKQSWYEVIPEDSYEDSLEDAAEEIAEENDITIEEAKEDYAWEVRDRAIMLEGIENPLIETLQETFEENGIYDISASEVLMDLYEEEVDLNNLENTLRKSEQLSYVEIEDGLGNGHIISQFFKNLGYDGIILTNPSSRFSNMGISESTSHIHVFDEYSNQIKMSDGSNVSYRSETNDIRFQEESVNEDINIIKTQNNIENTASNFDSKLELVNLFSSKEEVEIRKDIDSCG